jgi:hypothetical protein
MSSSHWNFKVHAQAKLAIQSVTQEMLTRGSLPQS